MTKLKYYDRIKVIALKVNARPYISSPREGDNDEVRRPDCGARSGRDGQDREDATGWKSPQRLQQDQGGTDNVGRAIDPSHDRSSNRQAHRQQRCSQGPVHEHRDW